MFKKRYIFLLLMILFVLIFICTYSLHGTYNDVLWTYKVPFNEKIKYLKQNESLVLLASKVKSKDIFYLRFFSKGNYELINTIKLEEPVNNLELLKDFVVLSTNNTSGKPDYIYVFKADTSNLMWKNLYSKGLWSFITENGSVYYVDFAGSIRKVGLIDREPIWRVITKDKFFDSTKPVISGNKVYVCNDDILVSLDKHTSKIEYNYKLPSKALDCKFSGDLAAILSRDEDVYVLNLNNSKILWKHKHILLFSKAFIEIFDNSFLALLNTVDFSKLKKTKRSKILTKKNQVLNMFDLYNGHSRWQKGLKYPLSKNKKDLMQNNIILLQTSDGRLSAYKLGDGNKLWSFFGTNSKTPNLTYTINNGKVYFVTDDKKESNLFVISLDDGGFINKIKIPKCKKDKIEPIIDGDKIFLTCRGKYIEAVKLPSKNIVDKKE